MAGINYDKVVPDNLLLDISWRLMLIFNDAYFKNICFVLRWSLSIYLIAISLNYM